MGADVKITSAFDSAGVRTGLAEMRGQFELAGKQIAALGGPLLAAFSVAGIVGFIEKVTQLSHHLQVLSDRFGVDVEDLQRLGNAAALNGSSLEAVAKAFNRLEIARSKALGGNEGLQKSFASLGISLEALKESSPEEIMRKLGAGSLDAANLVKVLGKGALELRPLLKGLADGSIEVGGALSGDTVRGLNEAHERIEKLKQALVIFGGETVLGTLVRTWEHWNGIMAGTPFLLEAVKKAASFDFDGARNAIGSIGLTISNQYQKGGRYYKPPRASYIGGGGEGSSATDDFGNLITTGAHPAGGGGDEPSAGGSGGGGGSKLSLAQQLAKIEEERLARRRSSEQQLAHLLNERADLLNKSAGLTLQELEGDVDINERLQSNLDLAKSQLAIDIARDKVAHEHSTADAKAAAEATSAREKSAEFQEKFSAALSKAVLTGAAQGQKRFDDAQQDALAGISEANDRLDHQAAVQHEITEEKDRAARIARADTESLRLEDRGQAQLAQYVRTRAHFEEEILAARKEGNKELERELKIQQDIVQRRQARDLDLTGRNGTGIAAGAPNYTDVALGLATDPLTGRVNQRELDRQRAFAELRLLRGESTPFTEQYQANRNLTQLSQNQTAQALEQQRLDNANRQLEIIRQLQELNGYVRPIPGDG